MIHLGDITKIHGNQIEPVDCITFGSPCQDLSIAGRRAGLAGERSGLFMEAVRIIKGMREATDGIYPTFAIWENVPGAFSSNGGEDFRAVLEELVRVERPDASIPRPPRGGRWSKAGAIAGNGWSLAWRQLDAQYWGVPQRRRRIALVADFGGQRAGEILFERTSLSGHSDESIQTWKSVTGTAQSCPAGNDRVVGERSFCISGNTVDRATNQNGTGVRENGSFTVNTVDRPAVAYSEAVPVLNDQGGGMMNVSYDVAGTLRAAEHGHQPIVFDARGNGDGKIAPTITGDHESRITDYTAIAISTKQISQSIAYDVANTIGASDYKEPQAVCTLYQNDRIQCRYDEQRNNAPAVTAKYGTGGLNTPLVTEKIVHWIVRRLTPTECERLQGYPDGWTDIGEWTDTKGKKHKPADTPRYKALGNSIALPQWFWIVQKMKPYMGDGAKLGSLFDGIGGFPLVWETTYGKGTARWASEIEEFPIAVTKRRFPDE